MADVVILDGEFAQAVQIINPGEPAAVDGMADLWQNDAGEFDVDGTLQATWTGLFPPGTLLKPLAEVLDVAADRWFWVAGLPEGRASLLTGLPDHVEAPLKTVFRVLTVFDVLRDSDATDRNSFGDEVETGSTPHLTGVDGAVTEVTQQVPTDGDLRTVKVIVGWLPAGTDVLHGDRLRQHGTDHIYAVQAVTQPLHTGLLDLRLDLTRTT